MHASHCLAQMEDIAKTELELMSATAGLASRDSTVKLVQNCTFCRHFNSISKKGGSVLEEFLYHYIVQFLTIFVQ